LELGKYCLILLVFFVLKIDAQDSYGLKNYSYDQFYFLDYDLNQDLIFLDKAENKCQYRFKVLKASFHASQNELYKTSEALLISLIECNPKDTLTYKELLKIYDLQGDKFKFESLMRLARKELSDQEFNKLQFTTAKVFNSNFYRYQYNLNPVYSSNINNGIDADFIKVFGLPFSVNEGDKPEASLGLNFLFNFSSFLTRKDNSFSKFNFSYDVKDYPNNLGDTEFYFASFSDNLGFKKMTFNIGKSLRTFGGSKVLESDIFNLRVLTKNNILNRIILGVRRDNYKAEYMTGISKQISFKTGYLFGEDSVSFERKDAKNKPFSFNKIFLDTGKISLSKNFTANFFVSDSRYKEIQSIFNKKRKDSSFGFSIEIVNLIMDKTMQLSFYKTNSNINLYSTKNIYFSFVN